VTTHDPSAHPAPPQPYYTDEAVTVLHGDALVVLGTLPDSSVHAVVTDPPYGLEFMGREWDGADGFRRSLNPTDAGRESVFGRASRTSPEYRAGALFQEWCEAWARECLRVLKPGGHMLAFGGSRTWHRLAAAIEDAGFEIRDSIAWLYGSGFPKSLDVSKAIDKAAGAEREVVGRVARDYTQNRQSDHASDNGIFGGERERLKTITAPATPDAEQWQGWGTALKPAFEPIVVARKPLTGTVAANVLTHGTGALNIDASRTATSDTDKAAINAKHAGMDPDSYVRKPGDSLNLSTNPMPLVQAQAHDAGRWPTNVLLDDTQAAELDRQSGATTSRIGKPRGAASGDGWGMTATGAEYDDEGGASRFFPTFRYEAKAPTDQRPRVNGIAHPTVKPLDLMRWLIRLITPPGGTILDPFAGSGTTLEAALIEGFQCIGIEREDDYLPLIRARITKPLETVLDLGGMA